MVLGLTGPVLAGQAEIDAQLKQLASDNKDARKKAQEALGKMGLPAVGPLLATVGHKKAEVGDAARTALHQIVEPIGRAGAAQEVQAVRKLLLTQLANAALPEKTRACVCRLLGHVRATEIMPVLIKEVGHKNRSVGKAAEMTLHKIVAPAGRLGGEYDRLAACSILTSELNNAALPLKTRAYICRLLSWVGREESVAALVTAMSAQDIGEMARWALSRSPTSIALDALHAALDKADAKERVGLVNAIGARMERRSVKVLAGRLGHPDEAVRIAAMEAISRIADPSAMDRLRPTLKDGSPKQQQAARAAWLALGETLLESGRPVAASVMFKEALTWETTIQDRCAALNGIGRACQPDALKALLASIKTADHADVRGTIGQALDQMPAPEVVPAIVTALSKQKRGLVLFRPKSLSAAARITLLGVLAERKDKAGQPGAVAMLKSGDESVRIAALKCLAVIGDEAAAPALALSLQKPAGDEQNAAVHALSRLRAPGGLKWLLEAVNQDGLGDPYRCLLIKSVSKRRDPGSVAALSKLVADKRCESCRVAAFNALGEIGRVQALSALIKGVDKEVGKDRDAAEEAMRKLGDDATEPMIDGLAKATRWQRVALLKVLGFRSHEKIKSLLLAGYKDKDTEVRKAAIEGLRRMADPSTLSALEEAANKGPAQGPAVSGMIRIATKLEKDKRAEALRVYHQALKLSKRDKERKAAIDRLTGLADVSSFDAVRPFLQKGNAKGQAAEAVLAIGVKLPDDRKADGIAALKTAIAIAPSSGRAKPAMEKLRKWGVDIDIAREAGFVTHWWMTGPFPSPDKKMFEGKAFPEDKVDLAAKTKVGDKEYTWKKVHITAGNGVMNLREAVASADNVACYGYAEVTSGKAQDVLLKMGSDDDVVCWLNGKKIHANKVSRGCVVDADVVKARLEKGVNRILMKVLNGGSDWQMCLRITDPQNKPLKLKQREK